MSWKRCLLGCAAVGFAGLPLTAGAPSEPDAGELTFTYRAIKHWNLILPSEKWTQIEDSIAIPHSEGDGFVAERLGPMALHVDTNADGRPDSKIKGAEGYLRLRGKDENGEKFAYAVRFMHDGKYYRFSASGAAVSKIAGNTVRVIDQNNNGRYDDWGVDAMIVGSSKAASLLSKVINVDGDLYTFDISADGRSGSYAAYEGETSTVDATSEYESRGKLIAAVVSSTDGENHFNVARDGKPMVVPAGKYKLVSGFVQRAGETAWIRGGKMRPIEAKEEDEVQIDWGGPVEAEFSYRVDEDTITVPPDVAFYGRAGEEYHTFKPNAKSPKIVVLDTLTRKEVASGRFGGC